MFVVAQWIHFLTVFLCKCSIIFSADLVVPPEWSPTNLNKKIPFFFFFISLKISSLKTHDDTHRIATIIPLFLSSVKSLSYLVLQKRKKMMWWPIHCVCEWLVYQFFIILIFESVNDVVKKNKFAKFMMANLLKKNHF